MDPFMELFSHEAMCMSYLYSKLPETGVPHHIGTGGLLPMRRGCSVLRHAAGHGEVAAARSAPRSSLTVPSRRRPRSPLHSVPWITAQRPRSLPERYRSTRTRALSLTETRVWISYPLMASHPKRRFLGADRAQFVVDVGGTSVRVWATFKMAEFPENQDAGCQVGHSIISKVDTPTSAVEQVAGSPDAGRQPQSANHLPRISLRSI